MNGPRYSVEGYLRRVCMVGSCILLVEGTSEKRMFKRMFNNLFPEMRDCLSKIAIDTAGIIQSPEAVGNRSIVELVCKLVSKDKLSAPGKFAGFVDREFRCFDLDNNAITDQLNTHMVTELLVWSRGHSLENYLFDYDILCDAIYHLVHNDPDDLDAALVVFESAFPSVLGVACSISLASKDLGRIGVVTGQVKWTALRLKDKSMMLDIPTWQEHLIKNARLDTQGVQELIDRYDYWKPIVESSKPEDVRWACHGHISESIIWESFARCMYEACGQDSKKAQRVLSGNKNVRRCTCIERWVERLCKGSHVYPEPVIEMLDVFHQPKKRESTNL